MRPWALTSHQCPWDETQEDFLQEGGLGVVWSRGHRWALWRTTQAGMLRVKRQVGEKQASKHCGCIFCLATPERRGNDYLHLTDQNPKMKTSSHTCWGHMQPEGTERSSASPLPEPRDGRPRAESTSWQKPRAPLGFRQPVPWGCLGSTRIQE